MRNVVKRAWARRMTKWCLSFCLFAFLPISANAQCGIDNTAFKSEL